jgi:hypothetical protein
VLNSITKTCWATLYSNSFICWKRFGYKSFSQPLVTCLSVYWALRWVYCLRAVVLLIYISIHKGVPSLCETCLLFYAPDISCCVVHLRIIHFIATRTLTCTISFHPSDIKTRNYNVNTLSKSKIKERVNPLIWSVQQNK